MRQYIGARYVPKFFENSATGDSTWAANTPYEPLTIVTWNNFSYTSKVKVPPSVGAPNLNTDYWVLTGDYTGAIGDVITRLGEAESDISALETDVDNLEDKDKYFLYPTGNNTDRSSDILSKLNSYGVCYFAAGDFYVESEIAMPEGSSLIGMGDRTRLHLNYNGNLIKMNSYCQVSNLNLYGQDSEIPYSEYNKGLRVGIYIDGDAQDSSSYGTYTRNNNLISDVFIHDFNGSGIKMHRTGGRYCAGLVNNVIILRCHTGIDIDVFSEFNSFTNVFVKHCNIANVMQGGNNAFNGCSFINNLAALVMDGENNSLVNDGHSTFSGCVFAHAGDNSGDLINIKHIRNGLAITGCTIFHGNVVISDSDAILINSNVIGMTGRNFTLTHCTNVIVNDNNFKGSAPSITTGDSTYTFENNRDTNGIIIRTAAKNIGSCNTEQEMYFLKGSYTRNQELPAACLVDGYVTLSFTHAKRILSGYQLTINSVTLLGYVNIPVSDVVVENTNPDYVRLKIPYASAVKKDAYIVSINYTITAA